MTKETTREEHLAWCKQRALEYCDKGEVQNAYKSFTSDMSKHSETANHSALRLGLLMLMGGQLYSSSEMRKFIEGFN